MVHKGMQVSIRGASEMADELSEAFSDVHGHDVPRAFDGMFSLA
jgi:hypothetical protein